MEMAMYRASTRILAGIVFISSTAGLVPQVAYAEPVCSNGTIAVGATEKFTFNLDSSMRAHFTLDADKQDVAMQIVDDAKNVACRTSLPNPGHQTCGWMPVDGAVYTVNIIRPLATDLIDASADVIPIADDSGDGANVGQGSAAGSSTQGGNTDDPLAGGSGAPVVVVDSTGVADAGFILCSSQDE